MQTLIRLDTEDLNWLTQVISESAREACIELQLDHSWSAEDLYNFFELVSINAKTKLLKRVRGLPSKVVYESLGNLVDRICRSILEDTLEDCRLTMEMPSKSAP